jgi:hypothetical protein
MMKVKTSKKFQGVSKRIKKLPQLYVGVVKGKLKKDASDVVKEFKKGIREDTFNLEKLKDKTIQKKIKKGYRRPKNPLYGKGGNDQRAYKNMMIIREGKNNITIRPSTRKHHEANLTLKQLFYIHEYGTVIRGRGNSLIRIKPRPAFERAFKRTQKKRIETTKSIQVKKAILNYMNKADVRLLREAQRRFEKDLETITK